MNLYGNVYWGVVEGEMPSGKKVLNVNRIEICQHDIDYFQLEAGHEINYRKEESSIITFENGDSIMVQFPPVCVVIKSEKMPHGRVGIQRPLAKAEN